VDFPDFLFEILNPRVQSLLHGAMRKSAMLHRK